MTAAESRQNAMFAKNSAKKSNLNERDEVHKNRKQKNEINSLVVTSRDRNH